MQYLDQNSPQVINEAYKIWKQHVPALYNVLHTYQLQSCSQTVEWLKESYIDNTWRCMNLFVGTNSISNNAVYLLNVYVPTDEAVVDVAEYAENRPEIDYKSPGYVGTMGQQNVEIKITLHQDSQVMRIRVGKADPLKQNLVAVKTGGSHPKLTVYNLQHPANEQQHNKMQLTGHLAEGYGLAWNNFESSVLASCSYDKKILVYDIGQQSTLPVRQINTNELLEDVKWTYNNQNLLCTASQNKLISIYDLRENSDKPSISKIAHNGEIYALDFNRFAQNLLLSAGEDGDIYLWDVRNMSKKFSSFIGHNADVTTVQWSPFKPTRFVSSSADRKVVVWDIKQTVTQTPVSQKSQNRTQEIGFIHNGHRSRVTDVGFSSQQNLIASCEENNVLQVWQMTQRFWNGK